MSSGTERSERQWGREGVIAGLIGAGVVALFYFIFDLMRGTPLLTPSALGEVFILRRPEAVTTQVDSTAVLLYSCLHLVAFLALGVLIAALARRSETSSLMRYAVMQVFVAFIVFFYGVLALASTTTRGLFPFWSVLAANGIAAAAMALYVWRRHPRLQAVFADTPFRDQNDEVTSAPRA
jgi:hypothetical protein